MDNLIKPTLKQYDDKDWDFVYSIDDEYFDTFFYATELLGENDKKCEALLRELIQNQPYFIDAYTYLGLAMKNQGNKEYSQMIEKAYHLAMESVPEEFDFEKHQVSWYNMDNRPFLRALEAYATECYEKKEYQVARDIFRKIISINPSDNQGVKYSLMEIYKKTEDYENADKLLNTYKEYFEDN